MLKNKKVTVLHLIAALGNGGAERQIIELLKMNRNHILCIFTNAGIYKKTLDSYGIKYYELNVKKPILIVFKLFSIAQILKKSNAHIMHSWMYNACLISSIIKILFKINIPLIWGIRCSNMEVKYYPMHLSLIIKICRYFSKKCSLIVYNSMEGKKYHKKIGFLNSNSKVVYNAVDYKRFKYSISIRKKLRSIYKFHKNDLVFLCVGRKDPMKNHSSLITAFKNIKKKYKNFKLVLIGKDTETIKMSKGDLALGVQLNIEEYYSMGDIIISVSSFGEGFSNVLVEGMATKLFPVATNVGDAKFIIEKTGLIIDTPCTMNIQKSLIKIASMERNFIKKKSERAVRRVIEKFNLNIMRKKYNQIYRDII